MDDYWKRVENIPKFRDMTVLLDDFRYLKDIPYEKYSGLYPLMKVFFLPRLLKGPFPPLEALACGVPVVLSDTGWARELVKT